MLVKIFLLGKEVPGYSIIDVDILAGPKGVSDLLDRNLKEEAFSTARAV